jgi:hypothetical protein
MAFTVKENIMEHIELSIHSIIDVITNSSTEIYCSYDKQSVESAKSIINTILKIAGAEKTADDYFDIYLWIDKWALIDIKSQMLKEDYTEEEIDKLIAEKNKIILKYASDSSMRLIIATKDGAESNMLTKMWDIFNAEAVYDG